MSADRINVNIARNRTEFHAWLTANHDSQPECWLTLKRGKPTDPVQPTDPTSSNCTPNSTSSNCTPNSDPTIFFYLDAVEEALCFGWIDSSTAKDANGAFIQRFSPRAKNSSWTELNKERVRRLERLGLMTDAGRKVLPPMGPRSFRIDPQIERALKDARVWSKFKQLPPLYQRVRASNLAATLSRDPHAYEKSLAHLIDATKNGELYGEWDDYGRLSNPFGLY